MTKQDFIAIASIIRGDVATSTPAQFQKLFCLTLSLADYFQRENPHFNRGVFYEACFGDVSWIVENSPDHDMPDPDPDDAPLFEGVKSAWIYGAPGD